MYKHVACAHQHDLPPRHETLDQPEAQPETHASGSAVLGSPLAQPPSPPQGAPAPEFPHERARMFHARLGDIQGQLNAAAQQLDSLVSLMGAITRQVRDMHIELAAFQAPGSRPDSHPGSSQHPPPENHFPHLAIRDGFEREAP